MNALLVQQLPRGSRLTAIFDSCHSATALDLPNVYDTQGQPKKQKYSRKTAGMDLLSAAAGLSHGNIFDKMQAGKVGLLLSLYVHIRTVGRSENLGGGTPSNSEIICVQNVGAKVEMVSYLKK